MFTWIGKLQFKGKSLFVCILSAIPGGIDQILKELTLYTSGQLGL